MQKKYCIYIILGKFGKIQIIHLNQCQSKNINDTEKTILLDKQFFCTNTNKTVSQRNNIANK